MQTSFTESPDRNQLLSNVAHVMYSVHCDDELMNARDFRAVNSTSHRKRVLVLDSAHTACHSMERVPELGSVHVVYHGTRKVREPSNTVCVSQHERSPRTE